MKKSLQKNLLGAMLLAAICSCEKELPTAVPLPWKLQAPGTSSPVTKAVDYTPTPPGSGTSGGCTGGSGGAGPIKCSPDPKTHPRPVNPCEKDTVVAPPPPIWE